MGLGSIIGGVAGAIGSIAGINSQNQANAFSREQFEYQKELHRNQMQWRVEDAKKAGLHPMAALGLSSSSFSPVSTSPVDYSGLTNSLSDMGQNIDSAICLLTPSRFNNTNQKPNCTIKKSNKNNKFKKSKAKHD